MAVRTFVNATDYALCVADGRTLAPGEHADLEESEVAGLVVSGRLRMIGVGPAPAASASPAPSVPAAPASPVPASPESEESK